MDFKNLSVSVLGAVLLAISSGTASAELETNQLSSQQKEMLISELIARGLVTVDPNSGELKLDKSVLSILQEFGLIKEGWSPERAAANCQKTNNCYSPRK